ncbi:MAG: lysylphosphatidylglycerol synthase transmembrane domain-containing protein [Myxococcota bacterium]
MAIPRRRLFNGLFLALGIALLGVLLAHLDPEEVWANLRRAGWMLLPAFGASLANLAFSGLTWSQTLEPGPARPPFLRVLGAFWAGHALNGVTPGGAGEVLKGSILSRTVRGEEVVASLVVFHYLTGAAMLVALVLSPLLALIWLDLSNAVIGAILGLGGIMALGMALLRILLRRGLAGDVLGLASRLPFVSTGRLDVWKERAVEVDDRIRAFRRRRPRAFARATVFALCVRLTLMVELWFFLLALLPEQHAAWLFLLAMLTQSTAQIINILAVFIPGRVGALEGGAALLFDLLGLSAVDGLALALLRRLRKVLTIALGLLVGAWLEASAGRRPMAEVTRRWDGP